MEEETKPFETEYDYLRNVFVLVDKDDGGDEN